MCVPICSSILVQIIFHFYYILCSFLCSTWRLRVLLSPCARRRKTIFFWKCYCVYIQIHLTNICPKWFLMYESGWEAMNARYCTSYQPMFVSFVLGWLSYPMQRHAYPCNIGAETWGPLLCRKPPGLTCGHPSTEVLDGVARTQWNNVHWSQSEWRRWCWMYIAWSHLHFEFDSGALTSCFSLWGYKGASAPEGSSGVVICSRAINGCTLVCQLRRPFLTNLEQDLRVSHRG